MHGRAPHRIGFHNMHGTDHAYYTFSVIFGACTSELYLGTCTRVNAVDVRLYSRSTLSHTRTYAAVRTAAAVVTSYGPPFIVSTAVPYYGTVVGCMRLSYITFT